MAPGCLLLRAVPLLVPGCPQASRGHQVLNTWDLGLSLSSVPKVSPGGFRGACCRFMGCVVDLISRMWCLVFPQGLSWHLCGPQANQYVFISIRSLVPDMWFFSYLKNPQTSLR